MNSSARNPNPMIFAPKIIRTSGILADFCPITRQSNYTNLIAHLTYRRFREFDTTWNTFRLLRRAYDHFSLFMDYIRDIEFTSQSNIRASIAAMKNRYETWLSEMDAIEIGQKGLNMRCR